MSRASRSLLVAVFLLWGSSALAEDMNEENLQRLQAILDRIRRESSESETG